MEVMAAGIANGEPTSLEIISQMLILPVMILYFILVYKVICRGILAGIFKYSSRVPLIIHLLLACITLFIPYLFILSAWSHRDYTKVTQNAISNPNDRTVQELLWFMEKYTVTNRPEVWNGMKETWNIINHSPNVSTDLKRQVIATFRTKGMYIGSSKVIDNYKGR